MKLYELGARRPQEQVAKVFEDRFGDRVSFANIDAGKARRMLTKVRALVREHRAGPNRHFSERNPDYLKLIMMEQALASMIREMDAEVVAVDVNDPKIKAAMDKAKRGQQLNPEETKTMAAIAAMKQESRKKGRMVREASELQQAQVVLAAQDMVDRIQKMMEDISEMQFKDLPALTDSIKNDMGVEQATQFQQQAAAALTNLLAAVQAGKTELENAQGVLTGQAPTVPGAEPAAAGALPAAEPETDIDAALGLDANLPPEEEEGEEAGAETLGRERR